jgi:radical SAM protein with 4Fe4S-binding SPASM domain
VVQAQPYGENYHPCNWLWKSMAIYWDGRVASCCADFSGDQVIGDVKTQSLREIWNSEGLVNLRTLQVEARYKDAPLCSGCDALWQRESTAWSVFSAAEKQVRPSRLRVGRGVKGRPHAGELNISPVAAEIGVQGQAALAAAANGYNPANPAAPQPPLPTVLN